MLSDTHSYLCYGSRVLQEAGIPRRFAPSVGIAVDHRRRNKSLESLQVRLGRFGRRLQDGTRHGMIH